MKRQITIDSKKVLIIDDDKSLRTLLEVLLKKDYQVQSLENGYEALFWLEKNEIPDLIIVDINMPRLDGLKFINHLKKSGFYRDIPIFVLSGFYDSAIKSKCSEAGVEKFFLKPFNPSELSDQIKYHLYGTNSKRIQYA